MKTLGIFGTSGFARETRDIAADLGYRCVFVAAGATETAGLSSDDEIMLEDDVAAKAASMVFAIGIGENRVREKIALRHAGRLEFATLIHPSASFGWRQRAAIENARGAIVCAGVRFTNSIHVGQFSIFNLNATIGHDSLLGDFINVSPGANISGNVRIGARCWIGTGAAINQGQPGAPLSIGDDTVIGSGSVVTKDCDAQAVYAGVPARRLR